MKKAIWKSILVLLVIGISVSCKKESGNKQNISYKIKTVIVDHYISGNFDSILSSDTISVNIDSFLNVLRNETSSTSNILTFVNNDLVCRIAHDPGYSEPSDFMVTTTNNKIKQFSYYIGFGSFGQYGSNNLDNNYTYLNNRLDSINSYYFEEYYADHSTTRVKNFKCNYNNDLLISFSGIDSLNHYSSYFQFDTSYTKQTTCSFSYAHSYSNPRNQINLDINDFVLNNVSNGYSINEKFIIQQLATYSTQSESLIEHAHYDYFNANESDISNKTLDIDVAYSFDNINRVESYTIKVFLGADLIDKNRYSIIYE